MAEPRGPVRSFWAGSLLVLGACVALWLAVQVFVRIWLWLLVGAIVVAAIYVAVLWLRRRRNRW